MPIIFGKSIIFLYYPWTKPQCEHYVKFHYLGTFYNRFHVFERKRNPYGKNTKKIWGKLEISALYQQISIASHGKN